MANVYILLIFIPLIAAVLIVFARFSLLFLKKIDENNNLTISEMITDLEPIPKLAKVL